MPYKRPTLKTLIDRADADMAQRLPGTEAALRRGNVGTLARIHAGAVHGLYGFLDYLSRQVLPDTAEVDYLERHASIYNITRKEASAGSGKARFTGTTGTVIAKGVKVQTVRAQIYVTMAAATLKEGQADVAIKAETAGKAGNIKADTVLTLVTPVGGVQSKAVALAPGIQGGTEPETDDSLRRRLLNRIQAPPHGGSQADYVAWARAVPGVGRAWAYPSELGLGTVTVRFMRTDGAIPAAADVKKVQDYIDARRPVTASVTVVAPIAKPLDLTFTALTPDTPAVRAAITAEIKDLLLREAEPGKTLLISHLREAISQAAGETDYVMVAPSTNVAHDTGQIATLGAPTWPAARAAGGGQ